MASQYFPFFNELTVNLSVPLAFIFLISSKEGAMRGQSRGRQLRRTGRRRSAVAMAGTAAAAVSIALPMLAAAPALAARAQPAAVRAAATQARPWLDQGQSPGQRASELLGQMTLAQKLQLVDGTGYPIGSD